MEPVTVTAEQDVTTRVVSLEDKIILANATTDLYLPATHTCRSAREVALALLTAADEIDGAHDEHGFEVIEAEPVLDLLEGQMELLAAVTQWTGVDPDEIHERKDDLAKVLRAHGRLAPVEPSDG